MGVDLSSILKKEHISFQDLENKKIAIDAYNAIYQFLSSIRQYDGGHLTDLNGNPTSHLVGLFYRTSKLLKQKIIPIYVFDGKPPIFKEKTLEKRKKIKQEAMINWIVAKEKKDFDSAKKYAQGTSKLTKEMVEESKELLKYMGVPIVLAKSEGEAQAAYFSNENIVDFCSSQDYDSLLFGAKRLIRNLTFSDKKRNGIKVSLQLINLQDILKELQINRKQLVLLSLLCGTDFNQGIRGIGPKKGLNIVKKCQNLNDLLNEIGKEKFEDEIEQVYDFFMNPEIENFENIVFRTIDPQVDKIKELLCQKHDFSEDRVENKISEFAKIYIDDKNQKGKQTNLLDW